MTTRKRVGADAKRRKRSWRKKRLVEDEANMPEREIDIASVREINVGTRKIHKKEGERERYSSRKKEKE